MPDEELLPANAVNGQVSNVSRLAGSALGGILAAAGGIVAVTLIDITSFVASAALLALVRTSGHTASREGGSVRARLAQVRAELRDGLQLTTRHRVLRALMIFALVTSVGEGIMSTLFPPSSSTCCTGRHRISALSSPPRRSAASSRRPPATGCARAAC